MRKLFRTLHLWLALPAGVFAVILCLTGAILVYQRDIQQALGASQYYVPAHEGRQALPLDTLVRVASRVAEADSRQLISMTLYADPSRTLDVGVAGQKGAAYNLNPYTAEVTGEGAPATRFFTDVRALHRWLMMSGEGRTAGRVIIGISTLFFLFISLSGHSATVKTPAHHYRASDTYKFDRRGNITTVERYADQPAARKVMGYAYLLHTGVWGGWLVKLLYFVACLGGAYLAVSGYWLYFKRATGRK